MRSRIRSVGTVVVALMVLGLTGCLFDASSTDDEELIPEYPADLSAPESLMVQLQVAYVLREAERFNELLAPEFLFKLHSRDALDLPSDHWDRAQEILATGMLFGEEDFGGFGSPVKRIRIHLTTLPSEESTLEDYPGVEIRLVRVMDTHLEVDLREAFTFLVNGHLQLFWFRRGVMEEGEDAGRWYLMRWQDLGSPTRKPADLDAPVPVEGTTWGKLRAQAGGFGAGAS